MKLHVIVIWRHLSARCGLVLFRLPSLGLDYNIVRLSFVKFLMLLHGPAASPSLVLMGVGLQTV